MLAVACLFADTHSDVIDLFTSMAAALSDSNVPEFMDAFDKNMPGYGNLKNRDHRVDDSGRGLLLRRAHQGRGR